jgi:hypothetical protein
MPRRRADLIERWLPRGWKTSKTGSNAIWKRLRGYVVAVMEDHEHLGRWKYRIGPEDRSQRYSDAVYASEHSAKRAVLEELDNLLGRS